MNINNIKLFGQRLNTSKFLISILLEIYGLNWSTSLYILSLHGLSKYIRIKNIPEFYLNFLNSMLKINFIITNTLIKNFKAKIRFKKALGTYNGLRLNLGLPSRGQRTHSNARTSKKKLY